MVVTHSGSRHSNVRRGANAFGACDSGHVGWIRMRTCLQMLLTKIVPEPTGTLGPTLCAWMDNESFLSCCMARPWCAGGGLFFFTSFDSVLGAHACEHSYSTCTCTRDMCTPTCATIRPHPTHARTHAWAARRNKARAHRRRHTVTGTDTHTDTHTHTHTHTDAA